MDGRAEPYSKPLTESLYWIEPAVCEYYVRIRLHGDPDLRRITIRQVRMTTL